MQRAKTIRGWVGRGGLDDVSRVSVVALAPRPAAAAVLGGPLRRSHATFVNRGLRLWELQRQQWLQPVLDERGVPIPVVKCVDRSSPSRPPPSSRRRVLARGLLRRTPPSRRGCTGRESVALGRRARVFLPIRSARP